MIDFECKIFVDARSKTKYLWLVVGKDQTSVPHKIPLSRVLNLKLD